MPTSALGTQCILRADVGIGPYRLCAINRNLYGLCKKTVSDDTVFFPYQSMDSKATKAVRTTRNAKLKPVNSST
jgi:hypothetical protein